MVALGSDQVQVNLRREGKCTLRYARSLVGMTVGQAMLALNQFEGPYAIPHPTLKLCLLKERGSTNFEYVEWVSDRILQSGDVLACYQRQES